MIIQTLQFGPIEVENEKILTFPSGLLGYPDRRKFALLSGYWGYRAYLLQSVENPELIFVVTNPILYVPEYQVGWQIVDHDDLGLDLPDDLDYAQLLVVMNHHGMGWVANLAAPIILNTKKHLGVQVFLEGSNWSARHPLEVQ